MAETAVKKPVSQGTCMLCGQIFTKTTMTKHLATCRKNAAAAAPPKKRETKPQPLLHLLVEGGYKNAYWLHLEVRAATTLYDLDAFLRRTWLECCGHLSAFDIDGRTYTSASDF